MNYLYVAAATLSLAFTAPPPSLPPARSIVVSSYNFSPQRLYLAAGEPVTLTFVNSSGSSHDFTARQFFAAAAIQSGTAPLGAIELGPHEAKSVTLIPRRGMYEAHCSHFLHKQMGMTAIVIVS